MHRITNQSPGVGVGDELGVCVVSGTGEGAMVVVASGISEDGTVTTGHGEGAVVHNIYIHEGSVVHRIQCTCLHTHCVL